MHTKWQKHTIRCQCYLQQFKNLKNPPQHEFVVFSFFDDDIHEQIHESYEQCNNCGIVHKITGLCTSTILKKEDASSIRSLEDIKIAIPDKLLALLERYKVDKATYEATEFVIQNELWGERIFLTKDDLDSQIQTKFLVILGQNLFKVDTITNTKSI